MLGSVLGIVGALAPPGVAALGVLALVGLVPGAMVVSVLPPLPRLLALVAIPSIGVSLVSLLLTAQLAAGISFPLGTRWLLVALGVIGGSLLALRGGPPRIGVSFRRPTERAAVVPFAVGLVGTACWLAAIPAVRASSYSSYGLGFQVPLLVVGVILCVLGALGAIRARAWGSAWVLLLLVVAARRGYTLLGTDAPLYEWTYRHLGVMDWFAHSGTLARDVDVYNNWPAALALASWVTQVSGLSRFDLAAAYILFHHVVLVIVVYTLARAAGLTRWAGLLAALLVELTDWVGQDYLAPQSFAMLLAIIVVAAFLTSRDERYRRGSLWVAFILFTAITWAHQLTPVWLVVVLIALVVLGAVRPVWILVPFLAVYVTMLAVNLEVLRAYGTGLSPNIASNVAGNIVTPVSPGQSFTSLVVTTLALTLWGSAGLVAAYRLWRTRAGLLEPILAFSPLVLLVTGYGGEAIYRVYLYSLPGVALILAPPLTRLLHHGGGRAVASAAAMLTFALAGLQGSLGGWYAGTFPREDVELATRLEQAAGDDGRIITPIFGFPREVTWHYVPQARTDALGVAVWSLQNELGTPQGLSTAPVDRLTDETRRYAAEQPVYIVLTTPMRAFATQYGPLPPGGIDELGRLLKDRGWRTVVDADGTTVYGNPAGQQAWEAASRAARAASGD